MKLNFKKIGAGKPLIIVHGLFGAADNWFTIARELEKDFTLYLVDQRNHGDSPHSQDWNYAVMAEDLKELMEQEDLSSASFLGHSMGGKTVMTIAMNYPHLVEKLIVADIAPRFYPIHHQQILKGLNSIPLDTIKSRKEADDILSEYIQIPGIRQFLLKSLGRGDSGGFKWKVNLPVITEKIANVGEAIASDKPFEKATLFMGGENSDYILESDKEDIDRFFPNSHLIYIKNAGHWLHAEQPAAVVETVRSFLNRS
jgi:pimeloyl-ACP methyl ester carboxylesterase